MFNLNLFIMKTNKKNHLKVISVATGVVVMSFGVANSYKLRAEASDGGNLCYKTFDSGTTTYTKCKDCSSVQGSNPLLQSTCTLVC